MRSRRRKWLRRAVFGLLALLALAAGGVTLEWYSTRWRGERRLAEAVARLDAEDPGWQLGELTAERNKRLPPQGQNAVGVVLLALDEAPPSYFEWSKQYDSRPGPVSNRLSDPAAAARAANVHARCFLALALLRPVRDLPEGGFALDVPDSANPLAIDFGHTDKLRDASRLLALDALVQARDGRPDQALQSCHAMLNVASGGIGDEPLLYSQLVRMAFTTNALTEVERTLAWNAAPVDLGGLQARVAAERDVPRLVYGYRGARALYFDLFRKFDAGTVRMKLSDIPAAERALAGYHGKELPAVQAEVLDSFSALAATAHLPDGERTAAVQTLKANLPEPRVVRIYQRSALSDIRSSCNFDDYENRLRARLGCAVTALACERFRQKAGRWPKTLAELPPDLLAAVPADPYTGKPILYRVHAEGVTVYATGADLADDGGTNLAEKDEPGADIGFRLWNPELRRAAPLPEVREVPE